MKLTQEQQQSFVNIINTATSAGIEAIVFQNKDIGVASGIRDGSCAIVVRNDVPPISMKMGLTRLPQLKKRLDLMNGAKMEMTLKESDRGEITLMDFVNGKTKTQYRCSASANIKAPATIADPGVLGLVTVNKEELTMALNGVRAMGATQVVIKVSDATGVVSIDMTDSNDKFSVELEQAIQFEEPDSAAFYYESGIFSSLLKAALGANDSLSFAVGTSGTIQFELNNCELSIFAQVDGDNQ